MVEGSNYFTTFWPISRTTLISE